jgi:hypothetical protein
LETGNYMNELNHVCFSYWTEQKKDRNFSSF